MSKVVYIILLVLGVAGGYFLYHHYHQNEYVASTEAHRNQKDIWLANDEASPFVKTNTPFKRLRYYPVDPAYRIRARFEPPAGADSLTLTTSTGEPQTYLIAGSAHFRLQGQNCSLLVLYVGPGENLFVPFMDATSGKTTYGAGRYLEAPRPDSDEIILDFNLAYNPYCAYVDAYTCPFPPRQNILPVAIEAGEKNYH